MFPTNDSCSLLQKETKPLDGPCQFSEAFPTLEEERHRTLSRKAIPMILSCGCCEDFEQPILHSPSRQGKKSAI